MRALRTESDVINNRVNGKTIVNRTLVMSTALARFFPAVYKQEAIVAELLPVSGHDERQQSRPGP